MDNLGTETESTDKLALSLPARRSDLADGWRSGFIPLGLQEWLCPNCLHLNELTQETLAFDFPPNPILTMAPSNSLLRLTVVTLNGLHDTRPALATKDCYLELKSSSARLSLCVPVAPVTLVLPKPLWV